MLAHACDVWRAEKGREACSNGLYIGVHIFELESPKFDYFAIFHQQADKTEGTNAKW